MARPKAKIDPTKELSSVKKELFAQAMANGESKRASAIKAGYSVKTAAQQGYKIAKEEAVIERIKHIKKERLEDLGFDKLFVSSKLKDAIIRLERLSIESESEKTQLLSTTELIRILKDFYNFFEVSENFQGVDSDINLIDYSDEELNKLIKQFGGK